MTCQAGGRRYALSGASCALWFRHRSVTIWSNLLFIIVEPMWRRESPLVPARLENNTTTRTAMKTNILSLKHPASWLTLACVNLAIQNAPAQTAWTWTNPGGDDIRCAPALGADGTIYITTRDGSLYGIDPTTHQSKWECYLGGDLQTSPALASDGTIYVTANPLPAQKDFRLVAINPANGTVGWEYAVTGQVLASPLVGPDGTVYFGSADNYFYALDPRTHLPKWRFNCGGTTSYGVTGAPVWGPDGTIYFGYYGSYPGGITVALIALTPGGQLKWKFGIVNNGAIWSSPAVGADGIIYFSCANANLYALNPNGTLKWSYSNGNEMEAKSGPVIAPDGTIFYAAGNGKRVIALNADGTLKWSSDQTGSNGQLFSNVANTAPVVAADGSIYVAATYYHYRFRGSDGAILEQSSRGNSLPAYGAMLLTPDGWLYYGKDDNVLRAYKVGVGPSLTSAWPMDRGDFRRAGMRGGYGRVPFCASMHYAANQVGIAVYGTAGKRYDLWASVDLKSWSPFTAVSLTSSNGVVFAADTMMPASSHRFYRAAEK